jgi:hypothetical protein
VELMKCVETGRVKEATAHVDLRDKPGGLYPHLGGEYRPPGSSCNMLLFGVLCQNIPLIPLIPPRK